jgi:hypothetical protein
MISHSVSAYRAAISALGNVALANPFASQTVAIAEGKELAARHLAMMPRSARSVQ